MTNCHELLQDCIIMGSEAAIQKKKHSGKTSKDLQVNIGTVASIRKDSDLFL